MTTETADLKSSSPPAGPGSSSFFVPRSSLRTYRAPVSNTWWLHNRRYTLFMIRELTAVPISLWLLSLLYGIARAGSGRAGWLTSPAYVAFSVVCLVFAVYHSVSWLGISGLILRVPLGERDLSPRLVTAANFALWVVASVVIGAALVFLWR